MWTRKISTHGKSLSINLPRQMCRDIGLDRGDIVVINYDRTNRVSFRKLSPEQVQAMHEIYGKDLATIQ